MANKVVQLVDENNDNLYPLSSDPNAAHITMTTTDPGEGAALGQNEFVAVYGGSTKVGTSDIVDGAVTSQKIDWATYYYSAGDIIQYTGGDNYHAGRQKIQGSTKTVALVVPVEKPISSSVSSVIFTPNGYCEVFDGTGTVFSINTPTSSQMAFSCSVSTSNRALIKVIITIVDQSITLHHNYSCSVFLGGNFTLA